MPRNHFQSLPVAHLGHIGDPLTLIDRYSLHVTAYAHCIEGTRS